jgi:hypothetical protein
MLSFRLIHVVWHETTGFASALVPPPSLAHHPGDQYTRTISYLTESELLFQAPTNEHRKMSRSLTPTQ